MGRIQVHIKADQRAAVYGRTNGRCYFCGCDLFNDNHSVDHALPLSRGGSKHKIHNLVAACVQCNKDKANQTIDEFRKFLLTKFPSEEHILFYGEVINDGAEYRRTHPKQPKLPKPYLLYPGKAHWIIGALPPCKQEPKIAPTSSAVLANWIKRTAVGKGEYPVIEEREVPLRAKPVAFVILEKEQNEEESQ